MKPTWKKPTPEEERAFRNIIHRFKEFVIAMSSPEYQPLFKDVKIEKIDESAKLLLELGNVVEKLFDHNIEGERITDSVVEILLNMMESFRIGPGHLQQFATLTSEFLVITMEFAKHEKLKMVKKLFEEASKSQEGKQILTGVIGKDGKPLSFEELEKEMTSDEFVNAIHQGVVGNDDMETCHHCGGHCAEHSSTCEDCCGSGYVKKKEKVH